MSDENKTLAERGIKPEFTKEEEAAAKFTYLLPFIKRAGSNLSQKAMARVLYALAEFPLGKSIKIEDMNFKSPAEKQLFHIFYEINSAKAIILDYAKTEENKNETSETNSEGEQSNESEA